MQFSDSSLTPGPLPLGEGESFSVSHKLHDGICRKISRQIKTSDGCSLSQRERVRVRESRATI